MKERRMPCSFTDSVPLENSIFSKSSERPVSGKKVIAHLTMKIRNLESLKVWPYSCCPTPIRSSSCLNDCSHNLLNIVRLTPYSKNTILKSRTNLCSYLSDSCSLSKRDLPLTKTSSFFQYSGYTLAN